MAFWYFSIFFYIFSNYTIFFPNRRLNIKNINHTSSKHPKTLSDWDKMASPRKCFNWKLSPGICEVRKMRQETLSSVISNNTQELDYQYFTRFKLILPPFFHPLILWMSHFAWVLVMFISIHNHVDLKRDVITPGERGKKRPLKTKILVHVAGTHPYPIALNFGVFFLFYG